MQKTKQQLFAFALALWAFSSCSQDASDTDGSATVGETVTISLDAEVSVDDSDLRAIEYNLGKNAKNQLMPLPQFTDGQEVEVHTILKSTRGDVVAETLKWRYDATTKKLVLKKDDGHDLTVSGFNNDNGTKWYISGLIGGALNGTKVEFMGTRVVKGVDGNVGDALGSMEVPYAFGWTELAIDRRSPRDGEGSHKYAGTFTSRNVQFKPLGSMLAVKVGNNQQAGAYTFTPKGFILISNTWGDQGAFELNTAIPQINPHTALPIWSETPCTMYYTFASGEEPGAIAHNQTTPKTYYVWVMPHKTLLYGATDVRVMLKGASSRPETATYKDYTNIWFTDYTTEGKTSQGRVTQGKVHALVARASHRLALPIEYVAEYNLAGGPHLPLEYGYSDLPGMTGDLRFASSHSNDQSGYYQLGRSDLNWLKTKVDDTFGAGNYFIPTDDQWWGVFPYSYRYWSGTSTTLNTAELIGIGSDDMDVFRQVYLSDYSRSFTSPHGVDDATDNAVFYAIRFKSHSISCDPIGHLDDDYPGYSMPRYYLPILDNSLKCAYRFTRVGGKASWDNIDFMKHNLSNQFIIDVVYLGEESVPTELATISDESWWLDQKLAGRVISRTFPIPGYTATPTGDPYDARLMLVSVGRWGSYYSSSLIDPQSGNKIATVNITERGIDPSSFLTRDGDGLSVRLFKRLDL